MPQRRENFNHAQLSPLPFQSTTQNDLQRCKTQVVEGGSQQREDDEVSMLADLSSLLDWADGASLHNSNKRVKHHEETSTELLARVDEMDHQVAELVRANRRLCQEQKRLLQENDTLKRILLIESSL